MDGGFSQESDIQKIERGPCLVSALKMEKERGHITERILDLTLEIMYLLTGEHYGPIKKSGDMTVSNHPYTERSPPSLTPERNKDSKILEVTQKMIELLTGEVPIRCQDVTVYFSMEEWEYIEGHKDLYKDDMMASQPALTSPDGSSNRNPPERCPRPLYSTQKNQEIPQEDQDENVTEDQEEEMYRRNDDQSEEEEEVPSDTTRRCSSPVDFQDVPGNHKILRACEGDTLINIKVEDEKNEEDLYVLGDEPCKEEDEVPPEISTGRRFSKSTLEEDPLTSPECEIEVEIPFDSPEEDLITPYLVLQNANPSSNAATPGRCFLDLTHPTANHAARRVGEVFVCEECGRSFDKRARLTVHQRSHTGEKPYLCSDCGKCFAQTSHLFRHVKVHSERKPFLCSDCGRRFKEKAHLLRHLKIHTGEKPYICPVCGKYFREKANLLQHDISHTGNYPFRCHQCGKCFLKKSRLDVHQMSHSGEKPYSCTECGKCFLHKSVFVRHQRVHSGVKPYICSVCGKCFRYQTHLTRHEKDHERVKS